MDSRLGNANVCESCRKFTTGIAVKWFVTAVQSSVTLHSRGTLHV